MFKRKNDYDDNAPLPRWVYVIAPLMILLIGGIGLLIGLELSRRSQEESYWAAYREALDKLPTPLDFRTETQTFTPTFIPPGFGATATAISIQATATALAQTRAAQPNTTMDAWTLAEPPCNASRCLDVLFLFDTTGSMGDEIAQLQNNILVITGKVAELDADVRYGLVAYRDRGDDYTTQVYRFTSNISEFQANLNALSAGGGGDTPEHLSAGLYAALHAVRWRETNTAKLMFLIGDAPPQFYGDYNYADEMQFALQKGIKIHTLASSGLDPQGEYIFRQIAQMTLGHFIFLTYDTQTTAVTGAPSGDYRPDLNVGEPEDEQGTGSYTVEQLDEIILRLIVEELHLREEQSPATYTPTPTAAADATIVAEMTCQVVVPPPTAPNGDFPPTYVSVCLNRATVRVGELVRIFAEGRGIGMAKYTLTRTNAEGEPLEEKMPILVLDGTAEADWKMEYIFTAANPGTAYYQIYASGEVSSGSPPAYSWGGGYSSLIEITVVE